jgi:hypothetical protein
MVNSSRKIGAARLRGLDGGFRRAWMRRAQFRRGAGGNGHAVVMIVRYGVFAGRNQAAESV